MPSMENFQVRVLAEIKMIQHCVYKLHKCAVLCVFFFLGISDGPNVSALTNGLDTPEERYTKLKKVCRVDRLLHTSDASWFPLISPAGGLIQITAYPI